MEVRMPPAAEKKKESFFQFITRLAVIGAAICAGGYFALKGEDMHALALKGLRLVGMVWLIFGLAPVLLQQVWRDRAKWWAAIRRWMKQQKGHRALSDTFTPVSAHSEPVSDRSAAVVSDQSVPGQFGILLAPYSLLPSNPRPHASSKLRADNAGEIISDALQLAGLPVEGDIQVLNLESGPTLQTVSFQLPPRLQLSTISKKKEDIANHLFGHSLGFDITSATNFRSAAAFVLPHDERAYVYMRDVVQDLINMKGKMALPVIFGKDVRGKPMIQDLAKMPHLLLAGATGSGKSVYINTVLTSLLSTQSPIELRLLLIDPKQVELAVYRGYPHLLSPPVTDPKQAIAALSKIVVEMERRYELLAKTFTRNIVQYNKKMPNETLPYIVVVIDEYADLMVVAGAAVEESVQRIAQKARAAGIHIILGTQRPSVDVVTGVIKANLPSRVAFRLESTHDYRTVLDGAAPQLLGFGDGICRIQGGSPQRFQSASISVEDMESTNFIEDLKTYWINSHQLSVPGQEEWDMSEEESAAAAQDFSTELMESEIHDDVPPWEETQEEHLEEVIAEEPYLAPDDEEEEEEADEGEPYEKALKLGRKQGGISVAMLQRSLRIGYVAAAQLLQRMVDEGRVGAHDPERNMRLWITSKEEQTLDDKVIMLNRMKRYICRTRTVKSTELRDLLGVRREKVLQYMQELTDEGFLDPPKAARLGYTIAWSEEEIQQFLAQMDTADGDDI
ncbi:FtsK/SpoIIIE domain-containing protein [Paenibacillus sp. MMO-58]|uniref:FtsK/SpoIIIE domain-containing protein n=1 Tax=Paenibacillus sp. MMO-58 TaxID=3081290 RepID=UPI00301A1DF0